MPGAKAPVQIRNMEQELWSVEDVAEFLKRSKKFVYELIRARKIPYIIAPSLGTGQRVRYAFVPAKVRAWALENEYDVE